MLHVRTIALGPQHGRIKKRHLLKISRDARAVASMASDATVPAECPLISDEKIARVQREYLRGKVAVPVLAFHRLSSAIANRQVASQKHPFPS